MSKSNRDDFPREKNWKLMYLRHRKLHRAQQLRLNFPRGRCTPPFDELQQASLRHYAIIHNASDQ
jgi:hypothetical protein